MTRRFALPVATLFAWLLTSGALPARGGRETGDRAAAGAAPVCDAGEILGYLYVNEETTDRTAEQADNVVSGFAAHADGCVDLLPGSPWSTGGKSGPGLALIAAPRAGIATRGDRLYALNRGTDDVAAFRVTPEGGLDPLVGSPFGTGGKGPEGMALSPDDRWLFVAHRDRRLSTLALAPDGRPTPAASFDLDAQANGLVVTRDGRFLVAALPHLARLAVLEIAADGSLRHAPGSPARADLNGADGLALDQDGAGLYVSASDLDRLAVSRYRLRDDGALDRVAGSPVFGPGGAGNVLAILPDGSHLLASQTGANLLSSFRVDASGGLTPTPVSPFPTGFGQRLPTGMAFEPLGRFLYVVHADGSGIATLRNLGNGFFGPGAAPAPSGVEGLPLAGLAFVPRAGSDADADGVPFPADNCGAAANPGQSDEDGDGIGDACDLCPLQSDPGQRDADRDGLGDRCDPDRDGDGVPDAADRCADRADPDQADEDHDGVGDACDNCPAIPNPGQEDADRDREGDACARPFVLIGRLYVQAESPDNAIAGYDVDTLGRMRRIQGSPFATGGSGPPAVTLFAPKRLEWSPLMPTLLFSANEGSDDLSVMRIGADGRLALATGRLRATGGSRPAGLAIRPHTVQLVVGHLGSANLALFQVSPNSGAVFGIAGGTIATQGRPSGLAFTPDGRWLEVALPDLGAARTLKIDPPYQFVPDSGIGDRNSRAATPLFNRAGDRLYLASSTGLESVVSSWSFANGLPRRLLRSPQTAGGSNSNIVFMHPDRRHLYVSQQTSHTIGVLRIEPSGELAPLGGPFEPAPFAVQPVGLASDPSGRFLFAGYAQSNTVAAYRITSAFALESLGEAEKTGAPAGRPLAGVIFVPAGDEDGDGRAALEDNCPAVANPGQADADGDGAGDACDPCPLDRGEDGDSDGDGRGDLCDDDRDGDGIADAADLCPSDADGDQTDTDGDARGDRCDRCRLDPLDDGDADGSCADIDNCPVVYNPFQENTDGDRNGDYCDNCPFLWNNDQADIDGANGGDACQRGFQQTGFLFVDSDAINNSVAVWETKSTGRLLPNPGSPYLTSGTGHLEVPSRTTAPSIGFAERGRFLYVLNTRSRDVSAFHLDADGLPRSIPGSPFPTGFDAPIGLVADASARSVWVVAREPEGGRLRRFDVARSGRPTPRSEGVVELEALPDGLALSPDGRWLAVSFPEAGRTRLFGVTEAGLVDPVTVPGGPARWDGVVPGLPRPGALAFVTAASGRLFLDVGSAAPDQAVVAALDLGSGLPAGPALDLAVPGGVSALAQADAGPAGSAPASARVYVTLPGPNAVAVIERLHGEGAPGLGPGSPFALPAGATEPVGLAFDAPWLHVVARQSNNLATFLVGPDGRLEPAPVPPSALGTGGGRPASGVVRFLLVDRDEDGIGPLSDNCPSAANPGQENRDGDGAGDACQPEIVLGPIVATPYLPPAAPIGPPEVATALAASLRLEEPEGEALSGRVVVAARGSVAATLQDAAAGGSLMPIDCARVLRPAAGIPGGIAYLNGSIGDAVLFDQDAFLACDDARADYELAEGACGTPGQPFTSALILNLRTPPFDVCVRPIADRAAVFDLRLEAIETDHLDLTSEVEQAIVDAPWDGPGPGPLSLEPLGAGDGSFTLAVTASDGDTPEVSARGTFHRDGAAALVFGAAPRPPGLVDRLSECAAAAGTPVDLDASDAVDPDGDALSFFWFEEDGTGGTRPIATGPAPHLSLPYGAHRLVLDVVDPTGLFARETFTVTIADTRPPEILRLAADPSVLWPPDHHLVPVGLRLDARDACFPTVEARLLEVTSSEPDDAPGGRDGNTVGDIVLPTSGAGPWQVGLRAERIASGPGRTYRARFAVEDPAGNASEATVTIVVPRTAPR